MGHSISNESEEGVLSTDSHLSNVGDSSGGNSNEGIVFKKGPWTPAEDVILVDYVKKHGEGNWSAIQKHSGLSRCGKSCRLRWANHLRPDLKKGAFTSEEERLIIELHAKMGNKWARMAAHLPGRTDNEIKNYWNTRIKRRQRAGVPVYPPELRLQGLPENQQSLNSPGICRGDKGCHDVLQIDGHKAPAVIVDNLKIFPYTAEFPDIFASGSLINGFGCSQFHNVPQTTGLQKHTHNRDELVLDYGGPADQAPSFDRVHNDNCEDKKFQSFSPCFTYDRDLPEQLWPLGVNRDSHFMSNGFFSASTPFAGAEKLELPSLQYQETGLVVWNTAPESKDSFIQSSINGPLASDCPSPRSSGLLEALLYEAKTLSKSENQFFDKAPSSTASTGYITDSSALKTCLPEFEGYLEPSSPSNNSIGSFFGECTPSHIIGSSLEETMPVQLVKSEPVDECWMLDGASKEIYDQLACSIPDVIHGSSWLGQTASSLKQQGSVTDSIAAFPSDDSVSELDMSIDSSASSWGLSSFSWNNMPAVCQMPDHL